MKPSPMITLGVGVFSLLAALGGLAFLTGSYHAGPPTCTGPVVERCDYVAVAKAAVAQTEHHPFQPDLGFEVFDQGVSVLIQQYTPPGEPGLNHAPSVVIDKRSCRACAVDWQQPAPYDSRDPPRGPLLSRIPPEDPEGAARRAEKWKDGPGGVSLL